MQRVIHNHSGYNYHASCVYTRMKCGPLTPAQKPGDRMRLVKTGWLCHYCGFTPNQQFLRIQHAVLQRHVRGE